MDDDKDAFLKLWEAAVLAMLPSALATAKPEETPGETTRRVIEIANRLLVERNSLPAEIDKYLLNRGPRLVT